MYLFPIGKVAIKKEDLCNHSGKETWFSLQPIDSNSEVQVNIKTCDWSDVGDCHTEKEWKPIILVHILRTYYTLF